MGKVAAGGSKNEDMKKEKGRRKHQLPREKEGMPGGKEEEEDGSKVGPVCFLSRAGKDESKRLGMCVIR